LRRCKEKKTKEIKKRSKKASDVFIVPQSAQSAHPVGRRPEFRRSPSFGPVAIEENKLKKKRTKKKKKKKVSFYHSVPISSYKSHRRHVNVGRVREGIDQSRIW
jgi:hypothetical protein